MLKIEVNEGNVAIAVAAGNLPLLCADTMTVIHVIYEELKKLSAEHAEAYKKMIVKNISIAFASDAEVKKAAEKAAKMDENADKAEKLDEAAAINAEFDRLIERLEGLMDCHAD